MSDTPNGDAEREPKDAEYGLVMPFVVTYDPCDGGTPTDERPYESGAFVAGCYQGEIAAWFAALDGLPAFDVPDAYEAATARLSVGWQVPSQLVPQLDLLAMHHRYRMEAEPWDEHPDEWTYVRFELPAPDDEETP